ncbi:thiamine ABC transporter substrate-binding protein [Haloechinothrix halophila]|uniref:thiamine ABC transporter substrate-binding protein n=1 Tax=Haloechinothrix halophila TaxID=1069073 RepID=UPI00146FB07A|nr:thiamine ABC transporter substrate-binding protein [Haloechinothrix halophila]
MSGKMWRVASRLVAGALASVLVAACGDPAESTSDPAAPTVMVLAYEGWSVPRELRDAFQRQTGFELSVKHVGASAASLTEHLTSSVGEPEGDVAVGLPARHAKRALAADVFASYTSPEANQGQHRFTIDDQQRLSAIDLADVCVNVDKSWFASRDRTKPKTLADLVRPEYAGLIALPDPSRTEAGFGFLLATIARYGETGWRQYWTQLRNNGAHLVPSLDAAYEERFSGASTSGSLPLVVAPASSPAEELKDDGTSPVAVLPDTCFRTVRYAGVLDDADHSERAHRVIDFLLSQQFQAAIAPTYGTYPTRERVELPEGWRGTAPLRTEPMTLPAADVTTSERRWLREWRAVWR